MSIDSVDFSIGLEIANVKDLAEQIAKKLNIGDGMGSAPEGSSATYKETYLEIAMMKGIVSTLTTNFGEMLEAMTNVSKINTTAIASEFKKIQKDAQDIEIKDETIMEMVEEFTKAMGDFFSRNIISSSPTSGRESDEGVRRGDRILPEEFEVFVDYDKIKSVTGDYLFTMIWEKMKDWGNTLISRIGQSEDYIVETVDKMKGSNLEIENLDTLLQQVSGRALKYVIPSERAELTRRTKVYEIINRIEPQKSGVTSESDRINFYKEYMEGLYSDIDLTSNEYGNAYNVIPTALSMAEEIYETGKQTFNDVLQQISIITGQSATDIRPREIVALWHEHGKTLLETGKVTEEQWVMAYKVLKSLETMDYFLNQDEALLRNTTNKLAILNQGTAQIVQKFRDVIPSDVLTGLFGSGLEKVTRNLIREGTAETGIDWSKPSYRSRPGLKGTTMPVKIPDIQSSKWTEETDFTRALAGETDIYTGLKLMLEQLKVVYLEVRDVDTYTSTKMKEDVDRGIRSVAEELSTKLPADFAQKIRETKPEYNDTENFPSIQAVIFDVLKRGIKDETNFAEAVKNALNIIPVTSATLGSGTFSRAFYDDYSNIYGQTNMGRDLSVEEVVSLLRTGDVITSDFIARITFENMRDALKELDADIAGINLLDALNDLDEDQRSRQEETTERILDSHKATIRQIATMHDELVKTIEDLVRR